MTIERKRRIWLRRALTHLWLIFPQPHNVGGRLQVALGSPKANDEPWDGMYHEATPLYPAHIVVNRALDDSIHVLCVLLHELAHFATETECAAHGNAFRRVARSVGLRSTKRELSTWTTPTPSLHQVLETILGKLGPYPKE